MKGSCSWGTCLWFGVFQAFAAAVLELGEEEGPPDGNSRARGPQGSLHLGLSRNRLSEGEGHSEQGPGTVRWEDLEILLLFGHVEVFDGHGLFVLHHPTYVR